VRLLNNFAKMAGDLASATLGSSPQQVTNGDTALVKNNVSVAFAA
jgi:hypothetical protein